MNDDAYSAGPLDVDVRQEAVSRLSMAMAAKTDDVLREAVTRFLGHDKWVPEELKGRGVMQHLPSGVEVFCLDGVALVELYPLTVEHESKRGSVVMNATRRHRFLVPNAKSEPTAPLLAQVGSTDGLCTEA